jgi:hypothetical protein
MYRVLLCTVLFFLFCTTDAEESTSTKASPPRLSAAELLGMRAGRVLGAAKICETEPERLQSIAKQTFAAVDEVGKSESDRASADRHMRDALNVGADDIKEGRITCEALQSALNRLEHQLIQRR